MNDFVVWLDSEKAAIFALMPTGIERTHLNKSGIDHHTRNKKDRHSDSNSEHFYRDLAVRLVGAEKILILGPGLSKDRFVSHLETHHSALKIIGVESSDHPTDKQILAAARKFFKTYNLFNRPLNPGA